MGRVADRDKARTVTQHRATPVCRDGERGAHLQVSLRPPCTDTNDAAVLHDEVRGLGAHAEVESRQRRALRGEEVEEVPLRREYQECVWFRKRAEVGHREASAVDDDVDGLQTGQRQTEKLLAQDHPCGATTGNDAFTLKGRLSAHADRICCGSSSSSPRACASLVVPD